MNKITISTLAAAGIAFSASAALAHGHLVTGPALYATTLPPASDRYTPPGGRDHTVGKSDNGIDAREFRAVQHDTHWLQRGELY